MRRRRLPDPNASLILDERAVRSPEATDRPAPPRRPATEHRGVRWHLERGDCAVRSGDLICARPGGHPLTGYDGWHITSDGRGFTGPDHAAAELRVRAALVDGDSGGLPAAEFPNPRRR